MASRLTLGIRTLGFHCVSTGNATFNAQFYCPVIRRR